MVSRLEIAEGVYVFAGRHPAPGIEVTSTIVSSGNSAIAFDSLCYPDDTRELLKDLKNANKNVVSLVNTHWHLDHTAGNQLLNTHTISQVQFTELIRSELPKQLAGSKEILGEEVKVEAPNETFEKRLQVQLGEKQLTLLHFPGHTPDSIAGYLAEERILVAGDTVMELPYLPYGNSADLVESLRSIEKMNVKTIIQGHGGPCNKTKVREDREYVEGLRRAVGEGVQSGKPLGELEKTPLDTFLAAERLKQMPALFKDHLHKENLTKVYNELTASAKRTKIQVPS